MLEVLLEIPVTFEPHWADKWMVWVTLGSVFVSAVIAGVAIASGIQSRKTAELAAEIARDSARIAKESLAVSKAGAARDQHRIDRSARSEVSLSMLRVLVAMDNYAYAPSAGAERSAMWREIRSSLDDALARIDVYTSVHGEDELRDWFDRNTDDLVVHANTENIQSPFLAGVQKLRDQVANWNGFTTPASELRDISLDVSWLKGPR